MTIPGSISQAPGAEFLERRLVRAPQRCHWHPVTPVARSLEVAAFVESVQLLREACELLPLTNAREPALPATSNSNMAQGVLGCAPLPACLPSAA